MTIATNISLHKILSEARRSHGMTQSALAKEVECKQSAISMMDRGKEDALAWPKIEAIAKKFDLNVEAFAPKSTEPIAQRAMTGDSTPRAFCPIFDCPANMPYVVNGKLYALPRAIVNPADKYCAYCGELLEKTCPECGASITAESACCQNCGTPYIATPEEIPEGLENWAKNQRQNMKDLGM
jgi:DNA-binding XRE family transcriptional regulator